MPSATRSSIPWCTSDGSNVSKLLLIGQAPGPNTNPDLPLYPYPATMTGGRLCKLMGITPQEYLHLFDRTNVLHYFPGKHARDDKFPKREARIAAQAIKPLLKDRHVLLVGRNVAEAFEYASLPFCTWTRDTRYDFDLACIPHPSGRNHFLHNAHNSDMVKRFLALLLELPRVASRRQTVAT